MDYLPRNRCDRATHIVNYLEKKQDPNHLGENNQPALVVQRLK